MFGNHSNIYLCVKEKTNNRYVCKKFDSYQDADSYYRVNYDTSQVSKSTMIPICKYIPLCLRPQVINWKLAKITIKSIIL